MNSIKARKRNIGLVIGAFAVFGIGFYELLFAPSQETSVYQNPDFPCVTAINPTVTDFSCVTAIAPTVTAPRHH
jgi:hypothetical protein